MAAVRRKTDGRDYRFAEEKLQTGIIDTYGKMDKSIELFRPALADRQKVGFFSQDRPSQTDVSEIVNLKEMTKVLRNVLGDVGVLKREIQLSKQIMKADYEARLKNKAIELYSRVNERMSQVEKLSEERIDSIRRAFRQQLSNSIHRLNSIYTAEMEKKIEEAKRDKLGDAAGLLDKYNELQETNERNKSVIQMLRLQLTDAITARPAPVQEPVRENVSVDSPRTGMDNEEELEDMRIEIKELEAKVERLVEELDVKDEETSELKMEIDNLKDALEKEKIFNQQLKHENEEMKANHDLEKSANKRQAEDLFCTGLGPAKKSHQHGGASQAKKGKGRHHHAHHHDHEFSPPNKRPALPPVGSAPPSEGSEDLALPSHESPLSLPQEHAPPIEESLAAPAHTDTNINTDIEKQRLELEREMESKMQKMKKEMSESAAGNLKNLQESEKNKIQLLTKQNQQLQQQLAQERSKNSTKSKEQMDMEAVRERERMLLAEIAVLKKEIDRIHRSWEKKFGILQSSLHALKDESYVRQSLQRQAATLHHAAISYAVDAPLGIRPSKQTPRKVPLPNIPKSDRGSKPDKEYYSYSISQSGPRFSIDENQIMSDAEADDIPADIAPLPEPPQRPSSSCGDDDNASRHSASHVVVLPSPLQAQ